MSDTRSLKQDQDCLLKALFALEHAAGHMSAIDVASAEASLAECEYRPLTHELIESATMLRQMVEEKYGIATSENAGEVRGEVHHLGGVSPNGAGDSG